MKVAACLLVSLVLVSFLEKSWAERGNESVEIEAGFSYEDLDKGHADWKSYYLESSKKFADRTVLHGRVREVERFSEDDLELSLGMYYPLGSRSTGLLEGTFSPTSHVLPKWSLFGEYQYVLGKGWVAHLGLRHAEFPDTGTYMGALTMEKYWGDYRAAIVLSPSVVEGAGLTASYRVVLDRYYGDGSRIGLGYTIGRELEKIGQDSVLATDVSAFNLLGRHRFPGQWAATYELSIHQQGDFYTRRGVRFGLRYIF